MRENEWRHTPHTRKVEKWERETPTGVRTARKLGRKAKTAKGVQK